VMGAASPAMDRRRTAWSGALLGIGMAGTLDEVLLHQILHWHHFYDRSTSAVGLVSDGLFHVASTMLLLVGVYRLGQHRGNPYTGWRRYFWAGVLLGLGGFNPGLMRSRCGMIQETERRSIGTIFVSDAKIMHKGASNAVYARCCPASNSLLAR